MNRKLLSLDVTLVAFLIWSGLHFRENWQQFETDHRVEKIQALPEPAAPLPAARPAGATTIAEWTDILSKDPFSFDRNDIPIVIAEPVAAQPSNLGPKPFLFGTIIFGN